MMSNRIIVAGAGASGIMAAIAAARQGAFAIITDSSPRVNAGGRIFLFSLGKNIFGRFLL